MPIWPFKWRVKDAASRPLSAKSRAVNAHASTDPALATSSLLRNPSRRSSRRKKRASSQRSPPSSSQRQRGDTLETHQMAASKNPSMADKENVPVRRGSVENITALPMSRKLDTSPHLRHAELARPPPIPVKFQQHSASQSIVSRQHSSAPPSRPQTLRSKRSTYDNAAQRKRSSQKRPNDPVREEEIRTMTTPIAIPKRTGDGPLRRDSKKMRGLGGHGSVVSIPTEESVHSAMSGHREQRGWAVGSLAVFSPRPAVRLSGAPQHGQVDNESKTSYILEKARSRKEKRPMSKRSLRSLKRQTIGDEADRLDANDLRVLLERDAKRRERKVQEQHERLEWKLKKAAAADQQDPGSSGRERANSGRKRQNAEDALGQEDGQRAREAMAPPTAVHPALRDQPVDSQIGSPFADTAAEFEPDKHTVEHVEHVIPTTEQQGTHNTGTYLDYPVRGDLPANPFEDPESEIAATHEAGRGTAMPASSTLIETSAETPMEEAVVGTAQAVRYEQTMTPPMSPVSQRRRGSAGPAQPESLIIPQRPSTVRQVSDSRERRPWASFFRRSATITRKPSEHAPSEASFSNASRESMRNQPLPAHLVSSPDTARFTSSVPTRTMSRFREDLPELPMSPPDSRTQSPDVTTMAAAVAVARRAKRGSRDIAEYESNDTHGPVRSDTPMSPIRSRGLVSASMASITSEGSWLAGGSGKRQSVQSGLSRSIGSLRQRRPELTASDEELGDMKDPEYNQRMSVGSINRRVSGSVTTGAIPDEEDSILEESEATQVDPLKVHQSVRRKPTLVHRDPRVKSREGLLTEYDSAEAVETPPGSPSHLKDDFEDAMETPVESPNEAPEPQLHSARSINYGKGHARQVSAGSAKLLDMPRSKRGSSAGIESPISPVHRTFPPASHS